MDNELISQNQCSGFEDVILIVRVPDTGLLNSFFNYEGICYQITEVNLNITFGGEPIIYGPFYDTLIARLSDNTGKKCCPTPTQTQSPTITPTKTPQPTQTATPLITFGRFIKCCDIQQGNPILESQIFKIYIDVSVGDAVFYQNECWTFTELVNFNELSNDPDSYQLVFPDTNCEDCTAQNICPTPTITNTITQTVSPTQTLTQTSTPSETPPIEIEYETVICNPCCGGGVVFVNVEQGTASYGDIVVSIAYNEQVPCLKIIEVPEFYLTRISQLGLWYQFGGNYGHVAHNMVSVVVITLKIIQKLDIEVESKT